MKAWVTQACQGIGAAELADEATFVDKDQAPVGYHAVCVCAHGNTQKFDYTIEEEGGKWTKGTAKLRCGPSVITSAYKCASI
ncbi:hypothetical protein EJ03DRAFT_376667 [Teratosphaeria nubilosa]|uniref:Uncharacterized protein n=1 Tax=Teratosphaeria nubilosa TaxID=161662 RepID=A0A6G1L2S7_9PEZI|nr:hypothetical protein EJ03DRAFT_376667 [Teratosphaeria nubilosa]